MAWLVVAMVAVGIWPTSSSPVELLCPGGELFAASEGRSLKLPAGCPALEAGLWRSVEGDARLFAEHEALVAERDQLRVELAEVQAKLTRCRQSAAIALSDCAGDLRRARDDLAGVQACACDEILMAGAACALCGVGAGVGTWFGGLE